MHLQADVHPPLYYLLIKGWLGLTGSSLEWLRAFSLLMALAGVWLAGYLIPSGPNISVWASWFFAVDGVALVMAVYGRMYTLLAVFCLLAWLGSDRWLRGQGKRWAVLAGLSILAGLCTHHFFALFLLGLAVWMVIVHGRTVQKLAIPWFTGAALWAIVWGRTAWDQMTNRPEHLAWVPPVTFGAWAVLVGSHLLFALVAAPVALVAAGWRRTASRGRWPQESAAAAAAAALALIVPGVVSVWKPVLNPRFTIIAAPFLAVALAPLGLWTRGVLPSTALLAAAIWLWWPRPGAECNSREAAIRLAAQTSPADTVLFCRLTRKPVEYHWPSPAPQRRSFPAGIDAHPGYEGRQSPDQLRAEARALAVSLRGRVFVLADTGRPASRILLRTLEEAGWQPHEPLLACAEAGKHYFNRLLVFDPPVRRAGFPSGAPPARGSPPPGPADPVYERR